MIHFKSLWYHSGHYDIIQVKKILFNVDMILFSVNNILFNVVVIIFMVEYDIIHVKMILFVLLPWPISVCFQYCNKVLKTLCQMFSMILSTFTYDIITTHVWYYSWSCVILFTVDQLLVNVKCATIHCHAMILIFLLYDSNHR